MKKITPDPPQATTEQFTHFSTSETAFGASCGDKRLFAVCKDISVEAALIHATELLGCASASAFEIANTLHESNRSQILAVFHLVEMAKGLVNASLEGTNKAGDPLCRI
ncbi:DUF6124 family protein [Pseudomonas akapageensis]|uniref:DUF6124 family protein n=1 Tax=Pseudomonas akapageensis TaxID=2609961 RepID=UPI00140D021A|nr:DUF3077 domain-containing protein [Pseudomonas akapageensis]